MHAIGRNLSCREGFTAVTRTGVITKNRQFIPSQEFVDRFHIDRFTRHFPRWGRIGKYPPFSIQQINLDAGIDLHVGIESGLQYLLIELTVGDQLVIHQQFLGQIPIEMLGQLLPIPLNHDPTDSQMDHADCDEQNHQNGGQSRIKSSKHYHSPQASLNL